jgi:hypothetical protein
MAQLLVQEHLLNDLRRFIVKRYPFYLPNSLLIAQEFILIHQNYGREFGLSTINYVIEDGIKQGRY